MESVSFCDALVDKYSTDCLDNDFREIEISPRRKALILKQQDHSLRQTLSLDSCGITHAGPADGIRNLCPNLYELDLSSNSISSWKEVFGIMSQLKKLVFFNLSHNELDVSLSSDQIEELVKDHQPLPELKKLVLNGTYLPFGVVCCLLTFLPSVEEIYLGLNGYTEIPDLECQVPSITHVHLSNNDINEWSHAENLVRVFPNASSIILCENPICSVEINRPELFQNLRKLSLTESCVDDWQSIDAISQLPALVEFRAAKIPLLESCSKDEGWKLLLARLPNVTHINGTKVCDEERDAAERMFIRHFMDKDEKPDRYHELVDKHGTIDRLANVDLTPSETASVTLFGDNIAKSKIVVVDLHQTTTDFRKTVGKLVDLKPSQFRLFYFDTGFEVMGGQEIRKSATARLMSYHIKDGDRIEVQRIDLQNLEHDG